MAQIPQSQFIRPTSVSVFRADPSGLGLAAAFLLTSTDVPSDSRARFDATESEVETVSYTPISERIEAGIVTYATLRNPDVVVISGVITATPLGLLGVPLGAFGSIVRRDLSEFRRFKAIADAREPVIVVAREGAWPSMLITQIQRSKVPDDGNSVRLSVTFQEVRIVTPAGVVDLVDFDSILAGAASSTDIGTQTSASAQVPADVAAGGLG